MSVVGRAAVGAVVAGACLLAAPAWAQEDLCAPGPDGQVPEMCQGAPVSDTPTVGMQPQDPCPAQPVEPGDGVGTDGDVAVAEPDQPEAEPEPAQDEQTQSAAGEDGVVCAFAVPVSAPVLEAAPASAAGGGRAVGQLPRTGPYDRLLALTAVGGALVIAGAAAAAAGRRTS